MEKVKAAVRVTIGLALLLLGIGIDLLAHAVALVDGLVLGCLIAIPAVLLMATGVCIISLSLLESKKGKKRRDWDPTGKE